jgi:hypothetical protein
MIIWHMAYSPAGVSMVDSIVQCVWGDKESVKKGRSARKGPQKQKLRADIVKMLGELKES